MDHARASDRSEDQRDREAIVVIAHGSRAAGANAAHVELCAALSRKLDRRVEVAFLELAPPDLDTVIDVCIERGADRIVVVPYFLHPGNHTTRDIPALVETARRRHDGCDIVITPLFGADPGVVELLTAQIDRARTRMGTGG